MGMWLHGISMGRNIESSLAREGFASALHRSSSTGRLPVLTLRKIQPVVTRHIEAMNTRANI